jgi:hypothetical protein
MFAPVMETEVRGSAAVPAFLSVKFFAVLVVPTVTLPKSALDGVSAALGEAAGEPVPVTVATAGDLGSLLATVTEDVYVVEGAYGSKTTESVQLLLAARVDPQLSVTVKAPGFGAPN